MSFITNSVKNKIQKLLGNVKEKFQIQITSKNDGEIKTIDVSPNKGKPIEPEFDDVDMRDKLLELIEQIMRTKGEEFKLELKFKRSIISTHLRNDIVAIFLISPDKQLVREEQMQGEITAVFDGEKLFPLKQWLIENIIVEQDVTELEKSLIHLV